MAGRATQILRYPRTTASSTSTSASSSSRDVSAVASAEAAKNMQLVPKLQSAATTSAIQETSRMNEALRQEVQRDLDELLGPGVAADIIADSRNSFQDVVELSSEILPILQRQSASLLRGEIPRDVEQVVRQAIGESAYNLTGGRSTSQGGVGLLARDLGRTSLDMINQGSALASQAFQVASSPITAAGQLLNTIQSLRTPLVNLAGVQQQTASSLFNATVRTPQQVASQEQSFQLEAERIRAQQQQKAQQAQQASTAAQQQQAYELAAIRDSDRRAADFEREQAFEASRIATQEQFAQMQRDQQVRVASETPTRRTGLGYTL